MENKTIAGAILVLLGCGIAYTGYEMSGSIANQVGEAFSGSPSDSVMLRYVIGAVCVAVGALIAR